MFIVGTALLAVAGAVLAKAGDRLAEETGLGGLAVGAVLLAAATSLPELLAVVSAALVGSADLVVSGVLGRSMANMAILAVLDLVHRRRVWSGWRWSTPGSPPWPSPDRAVTGTIWR